MWPDDEEAFAADFRRKRKTRCEDGLCGGCDDCLAAQGLSHMDEDDEGEDD